MRRSLLVLGVVLGFGCGGADFTIPNPLDGSGSEGSSGEGGTDDTGAPGDAMPDTILPNGCNNGVKDNVETDVDCGGGTCPGCAPGRACLMASDCATEVCTTLFCNMASGPPNWIARASMPSPRGLLGVATADRRIYAIGGQDANNFGTSTNEAYNPVTDAWQQALAPINPTRSRTGAVRAPQDGRIYVASGLSLQDNSAYDAVNNNWTARAVVNPVRQRVAAALGSDDRIYLVGNYNNPGTTVTSYHAGMDSWMAAASLTNGRFNIGATTGSDGRLYAIGGDGANGVTAEVDAYTPNQNMWAQVADLGSARSGVAAAGAPDGRVFAIGGSTTGGTSNQGNVAEVRAYIPIANRWFPVVPISAPRTEMGAAIGPDGRLFVIGGFNQNSAPVAIVEAYGPVVVPANTSGGAGSMSGINGSNFAANARVYIQFDGQTVAMGNSNGAGGLGTLAFTVPGNAAMGVHTVRVFDHRSLYPITYSFAVP